MKIMRSGKLDFSRKDMSFSSYFFWIYGPVGLVQFHTPWQEFRGEDPYHTALMPYLRILVFMASAGTFL